eukprot:587499-Hanusia_phi.AAC.1
MAHCCGSATLSSDTRSDTSTTVRSPGLIGPLALSRGGPRVVTESMVPSVPVGAVPSVPGPGSLSRTTKRLRAATVLGAAAPPGRGVVARR